MHHVESGKYRSGRFGVGVAVPVLLLVASTLLIPAAGAQERVESKDVALHSDNGDAKGIWSDGTTMWVADASDDKVYAYRLSDGVRQTDKEFDLASLPDTVPDDDPQRDTDDNHWPGGIWSDGTTMWVADGVDRKVYAYRLSDGVRQTDKEFALDGISRTDGVGGIWSDGTVLWALAVDSRKMFAYRLSDGLRQLTRDTGHLNPSGSENLHGIWSDGTVLWVVDVESGDDDVLSDVHAYRLSDSFPLPGYNFRFRLNTAEDPEPVFMWSDGETAWITRPAGKQIDAYRLPARDYAAHELIANVTAGDIHRVDGSAWSNLAGTTSPVRAGWPVQRELQPGIGRVTVSVVPAGDSSTVSIISPPDADTSREGHQMDLTTPPAGYGEAVGTVTVRATAPGGTTSTGEVSFSSFQCPDDAGFGRLAFDESARRCVSLERIYVEVAEVGGLGASCTGANSGSIALDYDSSSVGSPCGQTYVGGPARRWSISHVSSQIESFTYRGNLVWEVTGSAPFGLPVIMASVRPGANLSLFVLEEMLDGLEGLESTLRDDPDAVVPFFWGATPQNLRDQWLDHDRRLISSVYPDTPGPTAAAGIGGALGGTVGIGGTADTTSDTSGSDTGAGDASSSDTSSDSTSGDDTTSGASDTSSGSTSGDDTTSGASDTSSSTAEAAALSGELKEFPASHDGSGAFTGELSFNEDVSLGYVAVRDDVLDITGGDVTYVRRLERDSDTPNKRWEITVTPDGDAEVVITVPVTTDCDAAGAVCTSEGKMLTGIATLTIEGPVEDSPPPLGAEFRSGPASHDGETAFTVELAFNENIAIGYVGVRDDVMEVTGGDVTYVRRLERDSDTPNKRWEITVTPDGDAEVVITVPVTTDCDAAGAVCTSEGKMLTATATLTIPAAP